MCVGTIIQTQWDHGHFGGWVSKTIFQHLWDHRSMYFFECELCSCRSASCRMVDSPQQSVGDMSGKTFLLLLTAILCASTWFWSFPNSVVPVSRKWDDILNHMCRSNCEQWRSVGDWWRRWGTSITSAKKWAGKESVWRYCSYKAPSMRSWRFARNFVCVWVQNCHGTRATGYEEDLHVALLCHICLRISVSFGG